MEPLVLAGYVVQKSIDIGAPVTNLKLLKILYFIQLQSIKETGSMIMPNAVFEAWRFGPVITDVYYAYCLNGSMPIYSPERITCIPKNIPDYVDKIIDTAKTMRTWQLVALSHRENGAWEKAYFPGMSNTMNNKDIIFEAQTFNMVA